MEAPIRLKELRIDNGLTQLQVAQYLGVTDRTIYKWEIGMHEPDIDTIKKLCTLFKCSTDYFLRFTKYE